MSVTDKELEQLEQEINQKKAEVKNPDLGVDVAPPEPSQPTQEQKPSEPIETQPEQEEKPIDQPSGFDPKAYVEKKGWKTPEDAARSFRELEKKFHESNQKPKETNPYQAPQYQMPPQGYQPQPPAYYPQAGYQPPINPWNTQPRITEEQVASSYGMSVDDFRRVASLARDLSEAQMRQLQAEMQNKWEESSRQSERSADMANVFADPAFHNPEVQEEMHEILSKKPELMNERKTYSLALNQALINVGRRNVTGGNRQVYVPTTPPEMGGSKGAGGSLPGKRALAGLPSQKELESKTPEELEKILKKAGLFRSHMDSY